MLKQRAPQAFIGDVVEEFGHIHWPRARRVPGWCEHAVHDVGQGDHRPDDRPEQRLDGVRCQSVGVAHRQRHESSDDVGAQIGEPDATQAVPEALGVLRFDEGAVHACEVHK
jgi:hypothetical protein